MKAAFGVASSGALPQLPLSLLCRLLLYLAFACENTNRPFWLPSDTPEDQLRSWKKARLEEPDSHKLPDAATSSIPQSLHPNSKILFSHKK